MDNNDGLDIVSKTTLRHMILAGKRTKSAAVVGFIFLLIASISFGFCKQEANLKEDFSSLKESSGESEIVDIRAFIGKDYLIDAQHSYIGFKIKYFGFSPVRGRFNNFRATVFYDENDIANLSVALNIDVNSINTGNAQRDQDLLNGESWFNASKYPYITFRSKKVVPKTDGSFDIVGDFTMKGITRQISIPFEKPTAISRDYAGNYQIDYSGSLTLNRKDYGIEGGDFWSTVMENGLTQLSDEVEIELDMHTRRPDYQKRIDDTEETDIRKRILKIIRENSIDVALDSINEINKKEKINSGALLTIAYTLNEWKKHKEAREIFKKRLELFPTRKSTHSQLGITELFMGNIQLAKTHFNKTLEIDSLDTRATEYLKLISKHEL